MPTGVFGMSALALLLMLGFFAVPTNLAVFLETEDIGGPSLAGVAIALLTLASLVMGVVFAQTYLVLGRFTASAAIGCVAGGLLALSLSHNLGAVLLGMVLTGLGLGVLPPAILNRTANLVPPGASAPAIAAINSALFLGQFISPVILDWGAGLVSVPTARTTFVIAAAGFGAALLVALLVACRAGARDDSARNRAEP